MILLFTVPSACGAPGWGAAEGEQAFIAMDKAIRPESLKTVLNDASLIEFSE
jgi:hypothetical protein